MKLALVLFAVVALGSAYPTHRDLQGDLEDIVATIPLSEIRAIARKYAENDAEFQEVVKYLQGPEWAELVQTVADNETWQRFKAYMSDAGVDIDGVIQYLHDLIAGAPIPVAKKSEVRSVRDFVDEVLAILDLQAVLEALNDKLNNSADFQEFFGKISSEDAHQMVEEIRAIPEVQRIAQRLREMGIDVDKVIDLVYGLLGWSKKMTTRDLQGDLEDIVATIPLAEIREIARRYAETDAEFQEIVIYLQGPEWAELVQTVADNETWQRFKAYMADAGVDIDGVIQYLHDLIAGAPIPVAKKSEVRSVRDFVDEVLAILDLQAVLEALNDKLNNSPEFQEFFGKISSEDAHQMVEEIRAIPEVQRIAQRLREMGIDVDKVIDLVYGLLGWSKKMSTRDLQSDLEDIVATIPLSEIRAIARKYAENDEEFQEIVKYLQGPEWAELVQTVADNETWQRFKAYMSDAGVDIDGVIQYLHDLIAGAPIPVAKKSEVRSVRDFVDEVLAILDLQAVLEALNDKLNTSADFQEFFGKISSEDAHQMVEEIRAIPEVQRIAQRLREMGIDVDKVIDLVYGLLGWSK
ncbi:uncharacterized protein [Onthophagus taurus]|uniref:uncharacterized protein n=1 Tax=Onthophagus taurus TaxID=166361 RepID=UPI0039BE9CC0